MDLMKKFNDKHKIKNQVVLLCCKIVKSKIRKHLADLKLMS